MREDLNRVVDLASYRLTHPRPRPRAPELEGIGPAQPRTLTTAGAAHREQMLRHLAGQGAFRRCQGE